jgi:hypothetical protein
VTARGFQVFEQDIDVRTAVPMALAVALKIAGASETVNVSAHPPELLEAVALHHNPSRTTSDEFSPLTAVHVANALECEVSSDTDGLVVPEVDEAYLAGIGCLDRLEVWRAAVASREFTHAEARVRPPESVSAKPAPIAPEPVPAPPAMQSERTTKTEPPAAPESTPVVVNGLSGNAVRALLGQPAIRAEPAPGETWTYRSGKCEVDLFLFPDVTHGGLHVLDYRVNGAGSGQDVQACLRRLRDGRSG